MNRRLAELAVVATAVFAALIGWLPTVASPGSQIAPGSPPRSIAVALLLALPALVGWIGARTASRAVLVAAGVLCALGSVLAFSGVTLVLLVPALGFLVAAGRGAERRPDETGRRSWDPRRLAVLIVAAIPVALLIVTLTGVLGIVALVLLAAVLALTRSSAARPSTRVVVLAGGAVVITCAAAIALFATTEPVCWIRHGDGSVERIPPTDTIDLGPGDVSGGCDSAALTLRGVVMAAGLSAAAVGTAMVAAHFDQADS